jgi:hypothetical protein
VNALHKGLQPVYINVVCVVSVLWLEAIFFPQNSVQAGRQAGEFLCR